MQKAIGFTVCTAVMAASLYLLSGADPSQSLSAQTESASGFDSVARRFMEDARQLAKQGQVKEARSLAETAASWSATWQPGEQTPEEFLKELDGMAGGRQENPFSDQEGTDWPSLQADAEGTTDSPFFEDNAIQGDGEAAEAEPLPMNASVDVINHRQAKKLMTEAEKALADGDLSLARSRAMQAQAFETTWQMFDKTPAALLSEIDRMDGTTTFMANGQQSTAPATPDEAYRRAKALLVQARLSMSQGKLQQAQALAEQAEKLNAPYNLVEDSPALVKRDIAKRLQPGAAPASIFAAAEDSLQPSAKQVQAQALLQEARQALTEGRLSTAREKAQAAQSLHVAFGTFEDRPELVLEEVATALNGQSATNPFAEGLSNNAVDVTPAAAVQPNPFAMADAQVVAPSTPAPQPAPTQDIALTAAQAGQDNDVIVMPDTMKPMSDMAPLQVTANELDVKLSQLRTEVMNAIFRSQKLQEQDSKEALVVIERARQSVEDADLPAETAAVLTGQLDRAQKGAERWMELRAPLIAMEQNNKSVREEIEAEVENEIRIQREIADLTKQFNKLMKERRYAEAELVGQKAMDLDPNLPQTVIMVEKAKLQRQIALIEDLKERSDDNNLRALNGPLESMALPRGDYVLGDNWKDLTERRSHYGSGPVGTRTESEQRIQRSLSEQVSLHFNAVPLPEVIRHVATTHGINIALDTAAIETEGLRPDVEVSINVDGIRLESALNLVLKQAGGLVYHIEDEVLKITNRSEMESTYAVKVYNVADLVVPLTQDNNTDMFNANAVNRMGATNGLFQIEDDLDVGIGPNGFNSNRGGDRGLSRNNGADFTGLVDLITSTVEPTTWSVNGGQAELNGNENTLSLVIRQTDSVHRAITDLLGQLRKLQDLQVTVEVRFISVTDRFFERIGVDFDFNVQDNLGDPPGVPAFGSRQLTFPGGGGGGGAGGGGGGGQGGDLAGNNNQGGGQGGQGGQAGQQGGGGLFDPVNRVNSPRDDFNGQIAGLASPDAFTDDYDISFRQGSFELGVPDFGNFNPDAGIQVGMAILSDIEAFFFIQAAQADERANIMFAPKVTLFNGQTATITDNVQRPFVIALIPEVGNGAVGFTPIIQTIPDGINMSVTAVISADRRFVRLSLAPQFNNLVDVFTFSFASAAGGGGGGGFGGQGGGGQGGFGGGQGGGGGFGGQGGGGGGGFGGGGFGGIGGFAGGGGGQGGGGGGFGGGGGGQGGFGGGQGGGQGGFGGGGGGTLTVQQPVVESISVQTTVSVPDGGTVLLGGVKRLREGRNMAGVPILNKIPYVSRLFKNSGVGRETESVMLMVTPRIIIHEEEEELILGEAGSF